MPSQHMEATPDLGTVERLSTTFNRCLETLDAGEDVFAPDAFFDLYPPLSRCGVSSSRVPTRSAPCSAPSPRARRPRVS